MQIWQTILWAVLIAVLVGVEIGTVQLVAVWFAAGSLVAFIASLFRASFTLQIILFVLSSILLLAMTRPIVDRLLRNGRVPTNADALIGKECVVKEEICNLTAEGRVSVDGMTWSARNADGNDRIPVGTTCVIREIQGVKLMVEPSGRSSTKASA